MTVNNINTFKLKIYFILMMTITFLLMCNLMIMVSKMISKKFKINFEKMSPFECGFNPMMFKRIPFSLRFFLITIIFLIFDVEITLILPLILNIKTSNLMMWMSSTIFFMMILTIGMIYEWMMGALNWI